MDFHVPDLGAFAPRGVFRKPRKRAGWVHVIWRIRRWPGSMRLDRLSHKRAPGGHLEDLSFWCAL